MHFDVILHLLRFKLSPSPVHAVDLYCCFSIGLCGCHGLPSVGVTVMDGQALPFY